MAGKWENVSEQRTCRNDAIEDLIELLIETSGCPLKKNEQSQKSASKQDKAE